MRFFNRHSHGFCWDYLWLLVVHFLITKRNNLMMPTGRNNKHSALSTPSTGIDLCTPIITQVQNVMLTDIPTPKSNQISLQNPCRNRHGFSYALRVANQPGFLHTIDQRRRSMNTKTVVVHCAYSEDGKDITDIIQESFRLFLQKELRTFVIATHDGVS